MSTEQWVRLALDWLPFLIFLSLLVYFFRQMRGPKGQIPYQQAHRQYMQDHLAEVRRTNENLERIAKALEQHKD